MKDILQFKDQYRWLSNFWLVPIELDGVTYPSVENAYQAAKFNGVLARKFVQKAHPGEAKRLGRTATLSPTWEKEKLVIMKELLQQKFAPDTDLAEKLLSTGNVELQEGNRWGDKFWGVDLLTKEGQNMLGRMLMEIRTDLQRRERTKTNE